MEFISNSRGGRKLCFAGYMYNKKAAQIIADTLMSSSPAPELLAVIRRIR